MIAYLDFGAFDSLHRRDGCTAADVAALRKSVYGRDVTLALSIHHIEEIVIARRVSPQALSAQIRFTLSFASLRYLLKPSADLLIDEIRSYAASGAAGSPFLHGSAADAISSGIGELIESDGEEIAEDFVEALELARARRGDLALMIDRARAAAAVAPEGDRIVAAMRALAGAAGALAGCEERGISGLMGLRIVRMAAGIASEPPEPLAADHAIAAAARAEVVVSADPRIRELVARLSLDGLTSRGLPEFLATVRGA